MQTRKWQNQQGQERYSTEVVLQGFNGQLTMLDGRSGAGSGLSEGGSDYGDAGGGFGGGGGGFGGGSSEPKRASRSSGGGGSKGGGGALDKPFDDEIPF